MEIAILTPSTRELEIHQQARARFDEIKTLEPKIPWERRVRVKKQIRRKTTHPWGQTGPHSVFPKGSRGLNRPGMKKGLVRAGLRFFFFSGWIS